MYSGKKGRGVASYNRLHVCTTWGSVKNCSPRSEVLAEPTNYTPCLYRQHHNLRVTTTQQQLKIKKRTTWLSSQKRRCISKFFVRTPFIKNTRERNKNTFSLFQIDRRKTKEELCQVEWKHSFLVIDVIIDNEREGKKTLSGGRCLGKCFLYLRFHCCLSLTFH